MDEMSVYEFTEKDIEAVIRHLKISDPKNADRDYAIQVLELMQNKAHDIVRSSGLTEEEIEKALNDILDNKD